MRKGDSMGLKYFRLEEFDELKVFANLKNVPEIFLGKNEISRLRHFLGGMAVGMGVSGNTKKFEYINRFRDWYMENVKGAGTNSPFAHTLERCGGDEQTAFDMFFREFEKYLKEYHGLELPVPEETTR